MVLLLAGDPRCNLIPNRYWNNPHIKYNIITFTIKTKGQDKMTKIEITEASAELKRPLQKETRGRLYIYWKPAKSKMPLNSPIYSVEVTLLSKTG